MKIMKHDNPNFSALIQCASPDKKKPALRVVYFDSETGYLVTTNGQILFATKTLDKKPSCSGSYDIKAYAEKEEFVPVEQEFPNWRSLIHSDFLYTVGFTVPEFISKLSTASKKGRAVVTFKFKPDGSGGFESKVELGAEIPALGDTSTRFCMDLALLKPWAGRSGRLVIPPGNRSALFTLEGGTSLTATDYTSFAVLMWTRKEASSNGIIWANQIKSTDSPQLGL